MAANRRGISDKDNIWNIISSVIGAMDSEYTKGFGEIQCESLQLAWWIW